jgi:hypothetical protein
MLIRLSDKLQVTGAQQEDITKRIFDFMKAENEQNIIANRKTEDLTNQWLNLKDKPQWEKEKLGNLDFIAGIHEFIDTYRANIEQIDKLTQPEEV